MNGKKKLDELINEAEFLCETLPDEKQPGCRHLLNQLQAFSEDYLDLRMILNGLSEQFFITDSEENVLFVNNAYSNASKLLPEQLIGKTVTALVEEDHFFKDPIIPKVIKEKKELHTSVRMIVLSFLSVRRSSIQMARSAMLYRTTTDRKTSPISSIISPDLRNRKHWKRKTQSWTISGSTLTEIRIIVLVILLCCRSSIWLRV